MAFQLVVPKLNIPGLPPHFYVVGEAVGARCPNRTDDVELVQFLFTRISELQSKTPDKFAGVGQWDKVLGFEVFHAQYSLKLPVIDGVVSAIFSKAQILSKRSVMVFLLYTYFDLAPAEYLSLPTSPKISAALRRSLVSVSHWP